MYPISARGVSEKKAYAQSENTLVPEISCRAELSMSLESAFQPFTLNHAVAIAGEVIAVPRAA